MAKKTKTQNSWLQAAALRVMRVHFLYVASYIASIIIFDSWNLYPHEAIGNRWTLAGVLLVLNTVFWYICRIKFANQMIYFVAVLALIVADITFAGLNVFWERGLASKAVTLFTVPIIIAATLRSR